MKPLEKLKIIQEIEHLKKENKALKEKLFIECLGKEKTFKVNIEGIKFNSCMGTNIKLVLHTKELNEKQIIDVCNSKKITVTNIEMKDIEYDE